MKKSSELLNLESKIERIDDKQRVLNKFLLKPNMRVDQIGKSSLLNNLPSFIKEFQNKNEALLSDPSQVEKFNIENQKTNNKNDKMVKMVLYL